MRREAQAGAGAARQWRTAEALSPAVFQAAVLAGAALALAAVAASPFVPALRLAFSTVCHQAPERCFLWLGTPMPVCARCLGMYAGLAMAALWPVRAPGWWIRALAAANAIDWLAGLAPNRPRFVLALAFAWPAAAWLVRRLR